MWATTGSLDFALSHKLPRFLQCNMSLMLLMISLEFSVKGVVKGCLVTVEGFGPCSVQIIALPPHSSSHLCFFTPVLRCRWRLDCHHGESRNDEYLHISPLWSSSIR